MHRRPIREAASNGECAVAESALKSVDIQTVVHQLQDAISFLQSQWNPGSSKACIDDFDLPLEARVCAPAISTNVEFEFSGARKIRVNDLNKLQVDVACGIH